jgi:hypothetical protein
MTLVIRRKILMKINIVHGGVHNIMHYKYILIKGSRLLKQHSIILWGNNLVSTEIL